MTLLALWQRLTGAEARALRHQRDAYAEQAGIERRRADAAERERDAAVALLRALLAGEALSWARAADFVGDRPLSAPTPLEVATHLLRALVRDRDEAALAEAAEWLRRESPR